jgi:hypothetical protein
VTDGRCGVEQRERDAVPPQVPAQRQTRLAGTDDDDVELVRHLLRPFVCVLPPR